MSLIAADYSKITETKHATIADYHAKLLHAAAILTVCVICHSQLCVSYWFYNAMSWHVLYGRSVAMSLNE